MRLTPNAFTIWASDGNRWSGSQVDESIFSKIALFKRAYIGALLFGNALSKL